MRKPEISEGCLNFTLQELKEKVFEPIEKKYGVKTKYVFCERIIAPTDMIGKLNYVSFDFKGQENIDIHFFDNTMIGFFMNDDVIMFIDDEAKQNVRGIEDCIIYEGILRNKTHEQIFSTFLKLFDILYGTELIEFKEKLIEKRGFYRVNDYQVKLSSHADESKTIQFENIMFYIN